MLQVYRIGPRFNASVVHVDRRGSVDSGLPQVIRVGGTAGPRVVRVGPGRHAVQAGAPQVQVRNLFGNGVRIVVKYYRHLHLFALAIFSLSLSGIIACFLVAPLTDREDRADNENGKRS